MAKAPAFQFYPGDWLRDLPLRSCSIAARGLWIDLICLMWDGAPRGYLRVEGRVLGAEEVSRLVGATPRAVRCALDELAASGVLSKDADDGAIYSRRMVRDEAVRAARANGGRAGSEHGPKGAEHGSKGGRPPAGKPPSKPPSEPPYKPPPSSASASASANSPHTPSPPEGRASELGPYPTADLADAAFQVLLGRYPPEAVPSLVTAQHAWAEALPWMPPLCDLLAPLDRQKRSEQWAVRKAVPKLDRWLRERMWTGTVGAETTDSATTRYRRIE